MYVRRVDESGQTMFPLLPIKVVVDRAIADQRRQQPSDIEGIACANMSVRLQGCWLENPTHSALMQVRNELLPHLRERYIIAL